MLLGTCAVSQGPSQQCCDSGGIDERRPPLSAPPQPRVPSPQRRRAATRQRGAAGSARITSNTPFLARPRSPRFTQAIGGLALGLIALFSSYDHLTIAGRYFPIPQQWGIPLIAASVATVFTGCVQYGAPLRRDAQLASGSRLRAEHRAARAADEAARERDRATEARERQGQATARQDRCTLLSARVLLDPSDSNRARLQAFLSLIAGERPPEQGGVG